MHGNPPQWHNTEFESWNEKEAKALKPLLKSRYKTLLLVIETTTYSPLKKSKPESHTTKKHL
jgi:hypothetical protein